MNEQVRQGGGLLKGGGTGLARAKAATGKMGIKKGGKFRQSTQDNFNLTMNSDHFLRLTSIMLVFDIHLL